MSFFDKYSGTTNLRMVRLERLIWALIYGGLLTLVLGMFLEKDPAQDGSLFFVIGGVAVVVGIIMIYVRSRMSDQH